MTAEAAGLPVAVPAKGWVSVFNDLVKLRLTLLVVLTTLMGYFLGSPEGIDLLACMHAIAGTSVLAAGASALNQYLERDLDALMRRTASRPLPAGRMTPTAVLAFGVGTSLAGLAWLSLRTNPLTAFLGAMTLATYVFVYTPLKRVTILNTLVGAVPGALPPLMGWTAATGEVSARGMVLFAILFFWQLPHFMAISWLYRDEYAKAGFKMLSVEDPEGRRTAASAIRNTIALLAVSLVPFLQGAGGKTYLALALVLGGLFLMCAVRFAILLDAPSARRLFLASIVYLPVLLTFLVIDRAESGPSRVSLLGPGTMISVPLGPDAVFKSPDSFAGTGP